MEYRIAQPMIQPRGLYDKRKGITQDEVNEIRGDENIYLSISRRRLLQKFIAVLRTMLPRTRLLTTIPSTNGPPTDVLE